MASPDAQPESRFWSEFRRPLVVAGSVGAVLVLFLLVRTAWNIGLNPDQDVDQRYFVNNLIGLIGTQQFGNFFEPNSVRLEASYGYSFQALAFGVSWLGAVLGGESFDPFASGVLQMRNVLVLLTSLIILPSVFLISQSLSGKRWLGWVSVASVLLIPTFTGHAFINQKDMPLAVGFTAFTAAAVVFLRRVLVDPPPEQTSRKSLLALDHRQWALAGLLAFGICMTIGTRPPTAVPLVATCGVALGVAFRQRRVISRSDLWWAGLGLTIGTLVVIATNASASPNPVGWILDSISIAGDFPAWRAQQLVNGDYLLPEQLPQTHILGMVLAQTPLVMIVLVAAGILGLGRDLLTPGPWRMRSVMWIPVMIQLILLPAAGIIQGSLFYNASRQVLFIYPMIAVVAAWGVFTLSSWLPRGAVRTAGLGVVAVLALLPAIDTLTLFPYQYVYYNELTRGDLTNRYELDYWGISGPETQQWINQNFPDAMEINPGSWTLDRFASPGVDFVKAWPTGTNRELIWAGPWYPSWRFEDYPGCPIVHETTRNLWGDELRLGYVRRCTPQP